MKPSRFNREIKKVLENPGMLREDVPPLSEEKLVENFESLRRDAILDGAGSSVSTWFGAAAARFALRAAIMAVVFAAGYFLGTSGEPGSSTAQGEDGVLPGALSPAKVTVRLLLKAPEADKVEVAGDWNAWSPEAHPLLDEDGDGVWEVLIEVDRGVDYLYQFIIDGDLWMADPNARIQVDDGFGGTNSLLRV